MLNSYVQRVEIQSVVKLCDIKVIHDDDDNDDDDDDDDDVTQNLS